MSDNPLHEVESVFHAVLDLPPDDREAYLTKVCNGNAALFAEVSSLITAFDSRSGFIEKPALELGLKVLSKNSEESIVGQLIGTYEVMSRVGKGGMGEVYLAKDKKLGRNVALKFLTQEFVGDTWAKRQLEKEAQAVARLDHPNICSVYGIEESGEHVFIVMQFVEGTTLADSIKRGAISTAQVVPIAEQIVGALAEAHAHGIIHRDIKPKNIMVTPSGRVKVLDFGLAKSIQRTKGLLDSNDDSVSQFPNGGVQPGTIAYMSPEQLRSERLDYRSDVFSAGIVIYEMLGGTNPFSRSNPAETISAILFTNPPPPKAPNAKIPRDLERVVSKCLEKNRELRYQSANDLLINLDALSNSKRHAWTFSARYAIALALLLLVTFVGIYLYLQFTKMRLVAILPIENSTGDDGLNYMSGGFGDSISTKLTGLTKLRIKPASTLANYKNRGADPLQIGKELGVDAVLKGKLIKVDGIVSLHVSLLTTADGVTVWENTYRVNEPNDVFATETDIAQKITSKMEFRSKDDEQKARIAVGPQNPEARKHFWLGKYYWKNRGNKGTLNEAIAHLTKAIELEPDFAEAHAALADCYAYQNVVAYGTADTKEAMSKAVRAARDARDINNNLPEAHTALGTVYMKYYWDWQEAEREFREAIRLNAEHSPAHYGLSLLLSIRGRTAEGVSEGKIALELDPFSPATNLNYCRAMFYARQFDESSACFDKLVRDFPEYETGKYVRGWIDFYLGRKDDAIATFERIYSKDKRLGGAALGYSYGQVGRKADAQRILNEMLTILKEEKLPAQEIALIYYGLGDMDNAISWFDKSASEHFGPFATMMTDPIFDKLRQEPRFITILKTYDKPFPHASP
jgi:serine/threonine protein kinase/Flp pilus assembly protein TadD